MEQRQGLRWLISSFIRHHRLKPVVSLDLVESRLCLRPRRSEVPSLNTRELFCRSAAVVGRPRRTEPPSLNTRELFCRNAAVPHRPLEQKSSVTLRLPIDEKFAQPFPIRWFLIDGGRPRTAALRQKSVRVLTDGASVRWATGDPGTISRALERAPNYALEDFRKASEICDLLS